MALLSALVPVVVLSERTLVNTGPQESIAHWRNNQVPDQGIDLSYCLGNAATVRAVGNVEFCRNLLMRQRNQSVTPWFL